MKVLFITENRLERHGGIQFHVKMLMENLQVIPGHYECVHICGEELRRGTLGGKPYVSQKAIRDRIAEIDPDVIHIHGFASFFLTWALKWSLRTRSHVVFTPHSHPFETLRRPVLAKLFFRLVQQRVINRCQHLVVLTQQEKRFFETYRYRNHIHVIPNGFNYRDEGVTKEDKENLLLFIGRNDHNKRLDFIQQHEAFFQSLGMKVLAITNFDGEDTDTITYREGVSDEFLADAYRRAKVILIPSKFEAFSLVALDALKYKTAVLASDRVGVREYLEQEWYFSVFRYDSSSSFCEELKGLLDALEQKPCIEVSQQIQDLSWLNVTKRIADVYGRFCTRRAT